MKSLRHVFTRLLIYLLFLVLFPAWVFTDTGDVPAGRVLRFGADQNYPPLSFWKDGELLGFDTDLVEGLERAGELPIELVTAPWSSVLEDLEAGGLDGVCGILRTGERSRIFDFTIPYFFDSYMIFVSSGSDIQSVEDLAGHGAAILAGDAIIESFLAPRGLDREMHLTHSFARALEMVSSGDADYTIAPFSLGESTIEGMKLSSIKDVGRPLMKIEYRIGVKKGDTKLLWELNDAIATLWRSGRLEEIHRKWKVWKPFDRSTVEPVNPLFLVLAAGMLLMAALAALFFLVLRFKVRRDLSAVEGERNFLRQVLLSLPLPVYWKKINRVGPDQNRLWGNPSLSGAEDRVVETGREECLFLDGGAKSVTIAPVMEGGAESGDVRGLVAVEEDRRAYRELQQAMETMAEELSEAKRRVDELLIRDPLTGLFNASVMKRRIEEEISLFERYGTPFSLVLLRFHPVGESEGGVELDPDDTPLSELLGLIKVHLRDSDMAGRIGESLFLLFLPRTTREDAARIPARIKGAVTSGYIATALASWEGGTLSAMLERLRKETGG